MTPRPCRSVENPSPILPCKQGREPSGAAS